LLLGLAAAGCADDSGVGKTVPVRGQIALDGRPLAVKSGTVVFKPDTSRGNTCPFPPSGQIEEDGTYTLFTKGKKGAPPGWYKVSVTALGTPDLGTASRRGQRPLPRSLVPTRYGPPDTSGLEVEVVEDPAPGAYDLKLTKSE
jgi:hypothetical protein